MTLEEVVQTKEFRDRFYKVLRWSGWLESGNGLGGIIGLERLKELFAWMREQGVEWEEFT